MPRDPLIGLVGKPSSVRKLVCMPDSQPSIPREQSDTFKSTAHAFDLANQTSANRTTALAIMANDLCQLSSSTSPVLYLVLTKGEGWETSFWTTLDMLMHWFTLSMGYDPSQDIVWLRGEIVQWIQGNLMEKWGSIKRRHVALKASPVDTLQSQFSGYGSNQAMVARTLDKLQLKTPLESWDPETIGKVANAFTDEKFPTVCALNKIDHPDADKNIAKIAKQRDPNTIVLTSAISEVFLRKLAKQGYVRYVEGSDFVDAREDLVADGDPDGGGLKELDDKLKTRVENLKDMVLYRFGSTGVVQVLSRAAQLLGLVPVFPVRNVNTFSSGANSTGVFRDCVLVSKNSTVRDVAKKVMGDVAIAYIEGVGGTRVAETDIVEVGKNDILTFKVGKA
ncbi:unnamed protein product [Tuber melanosporum]|uniref:(Perigord truffle) hypothetical protein n=1 Tax=Tuber melanosporum (strain Mel28) TaxID=656061 RepID=D5GB58_TUBMM|nr:uncharacterized protein GSTUM_00005462001 [Tuber melanosporum]CAZ81751.1 unnamed protein product [Tuber melanosporum]